jgi:hypothetical protein
MVTVATIADRILKETGYNYSVIDSAEVTALTIVEYLVDNAIDELNAECSTTIADLTGSAGTKSLVGTETEVAATKLLSKLHLRARQDKGEVVGLGPMSSSQDSTDPYMTVLNEQLAVLKKRLKAVSGIALVVAEDDSGIT